MALGMAMSVGKFITTSTIVGWISIKYQSWCIEDDWMTDDALAFCPDYYTVIELNWRHIPRGVYPNDFDDPLISDRAPPAGQNVHLSMEKF